jgi:single-strand DNA-binding protein
MSLSPVRLPLSTTHFLGHCFRLIPAPGSFPASAFLVPPFDSFGSFPECSRLLWEQKPSLFVPQENGAEKGETQMYLNSATVVGFVGADPEQRQTKSNGAKFTVLSVATQRSWKNAQDEWSSKTEWHRVCVFSPRLADYVLQSIEKGSHVFIEGSLISSTYERANSKGKKATTSLLEAANPGTKNPQRQPKGDKASPRCFWNPQAVRRYCRRY